MEAPQLTVLQLSALGVPIDLVCVGSEASRVRAALAERWALCRREAGEAANRTVEVGLGPELADSVRPDLTEPRAVGADLDQLLVEVTHRITWQAVDCGVGSLLMFHAGAVANLRTGAAVVCVAPGGTGKTTACRVLGPGRGYLSDETVGIASDGRIAPYPKPLSVRRPDAPGAPKEEVAPGRHGLVPSEAPAYVEAVLILDRANDGPTEPVVARLDLFDAIIGVTPETSSLSRLPRPLHRLADVLDSASLLARVHYREAASLEPLVAGLVGPPSQAGAS